MVSNWMQSQITYLLDDHNGEDEYDEENDDVDMMMMNDDDLDYEEMDIADETDTEESDEDCNYEDEEPEEDLQLQSKEASGRKTGQIRIAKNKKCEVEQGCCVSAI